MEVRIGNMAGAGIVATLADHLYDASGADFNLSFSTDDERMGGRQHAVHRTAELLHHGERRFQLHRPEHHHADVDGDRRLGNSVSADQIITLEDLTAPVFDFVPEDVTWTATAATTPRWPRPPMPAPV